MTTAFEFGVTAPLNINVNTRLVQMSRGHQRAHRSTSPQTHPLPSGTEERSSTALSEGSGTREQKPRPSRDQTWMNCCWRRIRRCRFKNASPLFPSASVPLERSEDAGEITAAPNSSRWVWRFSDFRLCRPRLAATFLWNVIDFFAHLLQCITFELRIFKQRLSNSSALWLTPARIR